MEQITIRWRGPYRLDRINGHDESWNCGLYAIYEQVLNHPIELLYIGQTRRSFAQRIREHMRDWLHHLSGDVTLRLGTLEFERGRRFSNAKLDDIEALMIQLAKPSQNTKNMAYYWGREGLAVTNIGRRGLIRKSMSTDDLEPV